MSLSAGYASCNCASHALTVTGADNARCSVRLPVSSAMRAKYRILITTPFSTLATRFVFKSGVFNDNAFIGCLAHVINGERGDRTGGERFHLDAGFVVAAVGRADGDALCLIVQGKVNSCKCQRQAVTH